MKNYFLALMCFFALGFAPSCKDDEEDCANNAANIQDETDAMTDAALAYGLDPSTANCNAYHDAIHAYIDAIEPLVDCPGLSQAQRDAFQDGIDTYEDIADGLNC